jgi:hypothetical protein
MNAPTLTLKHGSLHLGDSMLLRMYAAGDCDRCAFPFANDRDRENLGCALFDQREMGNLPTGCDHVRLPDGSAFWIDEWVA